MAYYNHAVAPIGCFTEKEVGNYFEYSVNDTGMFPEYPHKVWIGNTLCGDQGFRFAKVKKTVAYILTDEETLERWSLKSNKEYTV
jgi:hypothetical protein